MAGKHPQDMLTGPERRALQQRLIDVHGFSIGQAAAIANSNNRADILNKIIERCRTFPKATT